MNWRKEANHDYNDDIANHHCSLILRKPQGKDTMSFSLLLGWAFVCFFIPANYSLIVYFTCK